MEEVGQHQERSRPTGSQCPSSDLLGRTNPTRGDRTQGATAEREEVDETGNSPTSSRVMRNGSRNLSMRKKTKDVETS